MCEGYKCLGTIVLEVPCFYWYWDAILFWEVFWGVINKSVKFK